MMHGRRMTISLSLMLIFAMTAFLSTYMMISSFNLNILQLASAGFVSEHAKFLDVTEDIAISAEEVQACLEQGTYLFRRQDNKNEQLEFFAIQSGTHFPIMSGKQFLLNDVDQQNTQVMLGKDASYILGGEIKVAELGITEPSLLDFQVFILPSSNQRTTLQRGIWICDGQGNVEKSVDKLRSRFGHACSITAPQLSGLYRITPSSSRIFRGILCLVLCCSILACVQMMMHWIDCCFYEQQCYERMGLSAMQQWYCFAKKIILLFLPSWMVGSLIALIALHTTAEAHVGSLILEIFMGCLSVVLLHAILFFTAKPQYPWSEGKK